MPENRTYMVFSITYPHKLMKSGRDFYLLILYSLILFTYFVLKLDHKIFATKMSECLVSEQSNLEKLIAPILERIPSYSV